ncbi:hypothetical protein IOK49_00270 [Fervidicoccus fontis]|jgi:hypothetical protein|nr:hypothetical protein [Fervidicoccus fontis]MBE9390525.1 hypothetical protein [Fervidicoccus fontis]
MGELCMLKIANSEEGISAEISLYDESTGKMVRREELGKEKNIRQISIKNSVLITSGIFGFTITLIVKDVTDIRLNNDILIIN